MKYEFIDEFGHLFILLCSCSFTSHQSLIYLYLVQLNNVWIYNLSQLFLPDILLNFRTTFVNQRGEVVTNSKDIAINYLKTWFFLDLVAALPFDFLDLFQLNQNLNLVNKIFTFLLFQRQSILNTEFLIN